MTSLWRKTTMIGIVVLVLVGLGVAVTTRSSEKGPATVTYQVVGSGPRAEVHFTNPGGGLDTLLSALPFRKDFEFGDGKRAHLNPILSGGTVTCTLRFDGVIVAQQTGSNVTCRATVGKAQALPGATEPPEMAAGTSGAASVEAKAGVVMKLPRYQGKKSPVTGRTTDKRAGISYAALGGFWGIPKPVIGDFVYTFKNDHSELARLASGRVWNTGPATSKGRNKLFDIALAFQRRDTKESYPEGTTVRDVVSQPYTVQGRKAWILGRELYYNSSVELTVVTVIDIGERRPTFVLVSIPQTHGAWRPDINQVLGSIKVL